MASRGANETVLLRENIENQLRRLLTQLQDVEQMKDELDEDEYMSIKQETLDQLKEFEQSLQKSQAGNMSLVDQISDAQLAIQAAIRNSASPEILNMFVQKQNGALRSRLATLDSDKKLGRISADAYRSQAIEILQMLQKLKEPLSPSEQELLQQATGIGGFSSVGSEVDAKVLAAASADIGAKK